LFLLGILNGLLRADLCTYDGCSVRECRRRARDVVYGGIRFGTIPAMFGFCILPFPLCKVPGQTCEGIAVFTLLVGVLLIVRGLNLEFRLSAQGWGRSFESMISTTTELVDVRTRMGLLRSHGWKRDFEKAHRSLLIQLRSLFQRRQVSFGYSHARAFNTRRMIFPLRVFGRDLTNSIFSGLAIGPSRVQCEPEFFRERSPPSDLL